VAAAVFSGCSGGISIDEMPARTAKAICGRYYECCTAAELMGNADFGPDRAACETNVANSFNGAKTVTPQSESKGRIAYRGDRLLECLDAYQKLTCEQLKSNATSKIPACDAVFEAKTGVDAGCGQDRDCIGGTCVGEGIGVDGVCVANATAGQACSSSGAACASGLYCNNGTCAATKADGQSCSLNLECTTGGCNGKNPDAGTPGTCGLKGGNGTTCHATQGCSAAGAGPPSALILLLAIAAGRRRPT
jgi:uncharacterized protein (TIGR03382 family)